MRWCYEELDFQSCVSYLLVMAGEQVQEKELNELPAPLNRLSIIN